MVVNESLQMDYLSPTRSLSVLLAALDAQIEAVIDVGVQLGTPFLTKTLPNATHFLFEPVSQYHASIESTYKQLGVRYSLEKQAVSDANGVLYQHNLTDGVQPDSITHSQLLASPNGEQFGKRLHSITQVSVTTLDSWACTTPLPANYLVKIDVDGLEEAIVNGASNVLRSAAVVVIETGLDRLSRRLAMLEEHDHTLFDIVGNGYYFDQLQQVDLITVSKALKLAHPRLSPWKLTAGSIDWEHWKQIV
jgi:FkbM family methyltransferase